MIKKRGGKYVVLSEKTGRKFGTYDTKPRPRSGCARWSSSNTEARRAAAAARPPDR